MHLNIGINSIYNTQNIKRQNIIFSRLKIIIETIIFILLIIIGISVLVYGTNIIKFLKYNFKIMEKNILLNGIFIRIGIIIFTFLVFIFIYSHISKYKNNIKLHAFGAIFGSVAINIISFIFSQYLDFFKGFSLIYGSLTTLILIMMWIYSCFFVIFLGAEINRNLTNIK